MNNAAHSEKPYHHGDLRQELMGSACEHIAREGTEKLSLRALAREAGVSATAPYRHFPTKNCLLAAIASEGFSELLERMRANTGHCQDPIEAITVCGRTYIEYALANPIKFHLMFGGAIADFSPYEDLQVTSSAAFDAVIELIGNAQRAGLVEQAPLEEVASYLWSAIHGVASLLIKLQKAEEQNANQVSNSMSSLRYMNEHLDALFNRVLRGVRV